MPLQHMTVDTAKDFWCPYAMVAVAGSPPVSGNRQHDLRRSNLTPQINNSHCCGNACAKWNWTDSTNTAATCGA